MPKDEDASRRISGQFPDRRASVRRTPSGQAFVDEVDHAARVTGWMRDVPHDPEQAIAVLEATLQTLWRQAEPTLGGVTLKAVLERVLHDASMRYAVFGTLVLDPKSGIEFSELKARVRADNAQEVREGTRFILTQFLHVIGTLAADTSRSDHGNRANGRRQDDAFSEARKNGTGRSPEQP
jgi:hypothetical protein